MRGVVRERRTICWLFYLVLDWNLVSADIKKEMRQVDNIQVPFIGRISSELLLLSTCDRIWGPDNKPASQSSIQCDRNSLWRLSDKHTRLD